MVSVHHYLIVSALLFSIGAAGVVLHRNLVSVFLCVELMLNAVNLTLVAHSRWVGNLEGQVIALLVVIVAACEAIVGLGILIAVYRGRTSLDVEDQNLLRY